MCGIVGAVNLVDKRPVPPGMIARMADAIVHRGPDDFGAFTIPGLAMANRRLSIVGLADGRQPISNEAQTIHVVYNGELFDYPERKAALEARGHHFRTHCDTELLPHLYEEHGIEMLPTLRGQFAVALWDQTQHRLILARDRFGICPLYWTKQGNWLLFASEIKALLSSGMVKAEADPQALRQFFTCISFPGPRTCFAGIQLLPAGRYLQIDDVGGHATVQEKIYWDLNFPDSGQELDTDKPEVFVDKLDELLQQAVARRLRADVPVVAYQSGGVDSSIIAAIANKQLGRAIPSYTISMDSPELDETSEANLVARHIGSKPTFLKYGHTQMFETYPRLIHAAEVPVIDTSCASLLLLAEKVHQDGYKVVLTGEGSDEWFAGYPWYKIHRMANWLNAIPGIPGTHWLRNAWRGILQLGGARVFPRQAELEGYEAGGGMNAWMDFYTQLGLNKLRFMTPKMLEGATPFELDGVPLPFERMKKWDPLNRGLAWGIRFQLAGLLLQAKGDRIAMNSSVEGRYPFLDEDVFDFAASIHPRWKLRGFQDKYLLRLVADRYLPKSISQRKKVIFRARFDSFFTQPNPPAYVAELLSPESLSKTGYFEHQAVHKMIEYVRNGTGLRLPGPRLIIEMGLVGVLATQMWHHYFIDGSLADLPTYEMPRRLVA